MQQKFFLKLIHFLLLPLVLLFFMLGVFTLLSAIAAPQLLIITFISFCINVYYFLSYKWIIKNDNENLQLSKNTFDWIKVNLIVSSVFFIYFIVNSISIIFIKSNTLHNVVEQTMLRFPAQFKNISIAEIERKLKIISILFIICSVLFLVHIRIVFIRLKKCTIENN